MAEPAAAERATGYVTGGISPFGPTLFPATSRNSATRPYAAARDVIAGSYSRHQAPLSA